MLDLTPGVNVRDGGRGESRLDVRGFDQRAVLFTLDGVPLYEPWNGIINLNSFPIEMLGSVDVNRGPSSSLFGPNGMAGTVSMTMNQPRAPLSATGYTLWRDSDFWDARAAAAIASGKARGLVGGRYVTSPGFPLPGDFGELPATRRRFEDGGQRRNSDRDEKSVFLDVGYDYAEQGRAGLAFLGSSASFGIPPSTTSFLGPFLRNDGQDLLHLQGSAEQRLTPSLGASGAIFYTRYDTKESQFDTDFANRILTTDADSGEVGGIGRITYDVAAADSLAAALQIRSDGADVSDSVNGLRAQPHSTITSLAAENVYLLGERVSLVTGLSFDLQSYGGRTLWEADPQGGVSVDFDEYGTSRAAISRKVRFPTLRELADPQQGNPDLQPENAVVFELGHRVRMPLWYADLNLFRSDVTNLIGNQGGDRGQFVNIEDATLQGIEVAFGGTPVTWMRVDVNYTYLDAHGSTTTRVGLTESDVQHRPPHRFNGILQVFLPLQFLLRLEGLYSSSQLDQFFSDVTVDGYTLFNLQLTKNFGRTVQLFAGVDNVLDAEHQDKLGEPGAGRWVFAGLRLTYD